MKSNDIILSHLLEKVDKLHEKLDVIAIDQREIKLDINYHIRRTDLLEEKVDNQGKLIDLMSAPFRAIVWLLKLVRIIK